MTCVITLPGRLIKCLCFINQVSLSHSHFFFTKRSEIGEAAGLETAVEPGRQLTAAIHDQTVAKSLELST